MVLSTRLRLYLWCFGPCGRSRKHLCKFCICEINARLTLKRLWRPPKPFVSMARIDFTNAEFAKMLPRTATWCKTPQVKPKPRLSTNPAPDCLSFQNNILYFNGQPIGMGVFYGALPSEGSEVTISGSTNAV